MKRLFVPKTKFLVAILFLVLILILPNRTHAQNAPYTPNTCSISISPTSGDENTTFTLTGSCPITSDSFTGYPSNAFWFNLTSGYSFPADTQIQYDSTTRTGAITLIANNVELIPGSYDIELIDTTQGSTPIATSFLQVSDSTDPGSGSGGSVDWQCGGTGGAAGACGTALCSCNAEECDVVNFICGQNSGCFPNPRKGSCSELAGQVPPGGFTNDQQQAAKGTCDNGYIFSGIGCMPYINEETFRNFWLARGVGVAGGIAMVLIAGAGFQISTSRGDPDKVGSARLMATAAISGLLLLLFIPFIISYAGVELLGILPRIL